MFTIGGALVAHPGNRDAREWMNTPTFLLHTLPVVAVYTLAGLFLIFIAPGISDPQRLGITIATIAGARFIAIGWWYAHLIRRIDDLQRPLVWQLKAATFLVAAAQILFIIFIADPGRFWTCGSAILIVGLSVWSGREVHGYWPDNAADRGGLRIKRDQCAE
jgi:hypothetical protein